MNQDYSVTCFLISSYLTLGDQCSPAIMSKDADQGSFSRQQSEGPSNPGNYHVRIVTPEPISSSTSYSMGLRNPTLSSSPSYSIGLARAPKKSRTSWLRYWASITPLICGGLGPALTLLAISGCADRWRT